MHRMRQRDLRRGMYIDDINPAVFNDIYVGNNRDMLKHMFKMYRSSYLSDQLKYCSTDTIIDLIDTCDRASMQFLVNILCRRYDSDSVIQYLNMKSVPSVRLVILDQLFDAGRGDLMVLVIENSGRYLIYQQAIDGSVCDIVERISTGECIHRKIGEVGLWHSDR